MFKSLKKILLLAVVITVGITISSCKKEIEKIEIENKLDVNIEKVYIDDQEIKSSAIEKNKNAVLDLEKKIEEGKTYKLKLQINDKNTVVYDGEFSGDTKFSLKMEGDEYLLIRHDKGSDVIVKSPVIKDEPKVEEDTKEVNTVEKSTQNNKTTTAQPVKKETVKKESNTSNTNTQSNTTKTNTSVNKNEENCITDALLND